MNASDYPDYVARNVEIWTRANAEYTGPNARAAWSEEDLVFGIWGTPDVTRAALGDVEGLDVVELGCGTAYLSARLMRHGARPVGVDPTPAQLTTAREMQKEFGLEFPLVEAVGESVPLPDASFDLAISEYGASIWADPQRWIPEAARLLRPGGRLVFLRNSMIAVLCSGLDAQTESLQRPARELRKITWADTGETEFQTPIGELIDILGAAGFVVERLIELYAADDAETHEYYSDITAEWARKWPAEELWIARLQSRSS